MYVYLSQRTVGGWFFFFCLCGGLFVCVRVCFGFFCCCCSVLVVVRLYEELIKCLKGGIYVGLTFLMQLLIKAAMWLDCLQVGSFRYWLLLSKPQTGGNVRKTVWPETRYSASTPSPRDKEREKERKWLDSLIKSCLKHAQVCADKVVIIVTIKSCYLLALMPKKSNHRLRLHYGRDNSSRPAKILCMPKGIYNLDVIYPP